LVKLNRGSSHGKVPATAQRGDQVDHAGRLGPGVILEFSGLEAAAAETAAAAAVAESAAGQQQDYDNNEEDREHGHLPRPN
jgi:hypothetical protein